MMSIYVKHDREIGYKCVVAMMKRRGILNDSDDQNNGTDDG